MTNKKEQIFEAVIALFEKHGMLTNLKVADIAKTADVGKGTVYEYFACKEEIITETLVYLLENSGQYVIENYNENHDFEKAMRLHIQTLIEVLDQNTTMNTLFMSQDVSGVISNESHLKIHSKILELKKGNHELLSAILKKGANEGMISSVTDSFLAIAISNTVITSIVYYFHGVKPCVIKSQDELIEKIYTLILKMAA